MTEDTNLTPETTVEADTNPSEGSLTETLAPIALMAAAAAGTAYLVRKFMRRNDAKAVTETHPEAIDVTSTEA